MPTTTVDLSDYSELRAYRTWRRRLTRMLIQRLGVAGMNALPDMAAREAFDAGITPDEFWLETVLSMIGEEFETVVVDEELEEEAPLPYVEVHGRRRSPVH